MASMAVTTSAVRVAERRGAVALAHHFRQAEGLSIVQITERLGRSPATVNAYFYARRARRRGRSRPVTSACAGAAAPTRSRATARVSTGEQKLALQLDALREVGCERVYQDVGSGSLRHRPKLDACFAYLRPGDPLVVWRLDRLGRGLKHLIDTVEQLHDHKIGFRSLTEQIDTTTPGGRLQFHVFGALAEFEREINRERTRSGLAAARARGRHGGRPAVITADKLAAAQLMRQQKRPMQAIATALGVSRATLYRNLDLATTELEREPAEEPSRLMSCSRR